MSPTSTKPFLASVPFRRWWHSTVQDVVASGLETAIERNEKKKGYVIGLSFGKGAHEEVARVKGKLGLDIELVPVQDLLDRTHPLAQEPTNIFGAALSPPVKRDPETLPTVDQLIDPTIQAMAAETFAVYGSDESVDSN